MENDKGVGVEDDHVLHTLRQVEARPDFQILGLVTLADYLDDRLGQEGDCFVILVWFATEDRDVRTLKGAVGEDNIDVGEMYTATFF